MFGVCVCVCMYMCPFRLTFFLFMHSVACGCVLSEMKQFFFVASSEGREGEIPPKCLLNSTPFSFLINYYYFSSFPIMMRDYIS